MSTLQIILSEEQAIQGGFQDSSEYFLKLLKDEQIRKAKMRLEAFLLEGLNSGEPEEATEEWWKKLENELEAEYRESQ